MVWQECVSVVHRVEVWDEGVLTLSQGTPKSS